MASRKTTVGVIGLGHVGAHTAYALGMMGVADVVKMCDPKEKKAISERQDLMDAVSFMPRRVDYRLADYEDMGDCDILINAAGDVSLCATGNRDDEMQFTVKQVAAFMPKIMAGGFDGVIINITNPCDIIARLVSEMSGLPKGRVFGTGTCLDSSRLIGAIARHTNLDPHSFNAFMMGEHGQAQIVPWSLVSFKGKPLADMEKDPRFVFDKEAVQKEAIGAGWTTYSGKFCTEYGICSSAATLAQAVLHDERKIFSCSVELDGEYGEHGIFCGVPAVIGEHGVEEVMEYNLPEGEKEAFQKCCAAIRGNLARAKDMLAGKR